MVADILGSLSFEQADDHVFADIHDQSVFSSDDFEAEHPSEEAQPVFVRGSVLDAFAAHDRVERAVISSHIAAIDSDDNGIYRLFRTR
ncbi:hypothetical protein [Gellertiella hungarica]|uniref:Uncharacterized protein n=1 Tax=Gellertiella hungarica TaxID=1572859 RepID=A0A7W6J8E7_9HYPH|nr:hypothetical protein [Gellertiella hungarica]MBB4065867.1 hypothetical protein [Gellertiella hungarica]